jgi:hypothetical protein
MLHTVVVCFDCSAFAYEGVQPGKKGCMKKRIGLLLGSLLAAHLAGAHICSHDWLRMAAAIF